MKTAIDTNVFSRIWSGGVDGEAAWDALEICSREGSLVVCPVVYAELLGNPLISMEKLKVFFEETDVQVDWQLREGVWHQAGTRFRQYVERRRIHGGGEARRLLSDFVVGSHALVQANRLLTYDVRDFRVDFPDLQLAEAR